MKKLLFAILASVLLLSACGKMETTDDLIKKARKEIPISDAENTDISFAGKCQNDSYSLLCSSREMSINCTIIFLWNVLKPTTAANSSKLSSLSTAEKISPHSSGTAMLLSSIIRTAKR